MPNSSKKVWWKCPKGHEWEATVCNRNKGRGCPVCSSEISTSYPEQAIHFYLNKLFDTKNRYLIEGKEVDIYIKKYGVGIEYDGILFHSSEESQKKEHKKDLFLKDKGIFLIRVKESNKNYYDSYKKVIYYKPMSSYKNLDAVINMIIKILNKKFNLKLKLDVNLKRDNNEILSFYKTIKKNNSLSVCNKEILKEWNYEKNKGLDPDYFDAGSGYKVWWKCSKGHEWEATIHSRTYQKNGCPYCSNRLVLQGYNDFETKYQKLLKEWNYEKNNALGIFPNHVLPGSSKKVWWKCPKGHEYYSEIRSRAVYGYGCKFCAGHAMVKGENDLATSNPKLLDEWDYKKNKKQPSEYSASSNDKVWWKCSKGHEWLASISNRNHKNHPTKCPYCQKNKKRGEKHET